MQPLSIIAFIEHATLHAIYQVILLQKVHVDPLIQALATAHYCAGQLAVPKSNLTTLVLLPGIVSTLSASLSGDGKTELAHI